MNDAIATLESIGTKEIPVDKESIKENQSLYSLSKTSTTETRQLFPFLGEVERKLDGEIRLVAVGGTAMTLLNRKPSTKDIVVTKAARLNDRDWQDIEACLAKGNLTEEQIFTRSAKVGYVGNEATFEPNIQLVVDRFLKKKGGNP